nr:GPN-loop GTPase 3 [Ipomoea batatas]
MSSRALLGSWVQIELPLLRERNKKSGNASESYTNDGDENLHENLDKITESCEEHLSSSATNEITDVQDLKNPCGDEEGISFPGRTCDMPPPHPIAISTVSKDIRLRRMGYAQLVIGPAGSGKSTYCSNLHRHCEATRRTIHIVNLDPAAENFDYPVAMDIRELISLDDVMEELHLGPNGGLIYCMEHLEENLDDWLTEELDNYMDDDYLVFDCPGQIELFSHVPVLKNFVEHLKRKNFNVCVVYLLDSQFITDVTKFISGCMASLSAMVQLELPHVNILSKMDLVTNKKDIDNYLNPEPQLLLADLNQRMAPQFQKLNKSLIELVDQYSMVSFMPLDLRKDSRVAQVANELLCGDDPRDNPGLIPTSASSYASQSEWGLVRRKTRNTSCIQYILSQIDNCIQYGEDADVKVKDFDAEEDD